MLPIKTPPYHFAACLILAVAAAGCSERQKQAKTEIQAKSFADAGELEKAKISYLNVLRKDPGNTQAISELGRIWMEQGAPLRALPYLLKTREVTPQDAAARYRLARAFMSLAERREAYKEATEVLKLDPAHGDALNLLVEAAMTDEQKEAARQAIQSFPNPNSADRLVAGVRFLLDANDLPAAEEAVTRALAVEPGSVRALAAAGGLRVIQKDSDGAEQRFKEAAERAQPRSPQKIQYADFVALRGRTDEARALVAEACKQAPDYIPAWMLASRLATAASKPDEALAALDRIFGLDPDNYPARLQQADILVGTQQVAKAIGILEKLDEAHPRQSTVKFKLGSAYLQSGDAEKAATALREAVDLAPNFPEAVFMLAQIDLRSGRAEAAVAGLKRLLEKDPSRLQAAVALADGYAELGQKEEALATLKKVVEAAPENVDYLLKLGLLLAQGGHADEARTIDEKVLQLSPGNVTAISQLVDLDLLAKQYPAAEVRVKQLLDQTPGSVPGHVMMARIHAVQSAWDEAEKSLLKALELEAGDRVAQAMLIQVRRAAGKLPQAIEQAEAALAKNPADVGILRQLSMMYGEQGNYAKAAEAYEKLLKAQRSPDAFVLNNLATIYGVYLNQPDRAYELARQARELRPGVGLALTPDAKLEAASIADTLGWMSYRRGEYAQALSLAQEAASHMADNAEVQYHLGMAAAAMGRNETALKALGIASAATTSFEGQAEARQHFALLGGGGAAPAGSADLSAMLAKAPKELVLQMRLAEAFEREKKLPEAAAAYAAALSRNPSLLVAAQRLGELYAGPLKDSAKALEYARAARQLAPNDPKVAALLGPLVFETGDHTFAYNLLREATRADAPDPSALAALARAAYSLGKVEEAREAMEKALAAVPDAPFAEEGRLFLALTDPAAAADTATVDKALQQDPRHVPALMVRAAAQTAKKDDAGAAASYQAVLAVYPAFVPAAKQLALLLAAQPDARDRAFELAGQARKALPDDPDVADVLGRLSYHRKETRQAVQLLLEAARIRPLAPDSLRCLGLAQIAEGETEAGRETLTKALAAGLPETEAAEVSKALEQNK